MKIRLIELADGSCNEVCGRWIVFYDPDYHDPVFGYDGGQLVTTDDESKATDYPYAAAVALWKSGPSCACHRLRDDGKPNRPLTAFTVNMT